MFHEDIEKDKNNLWNFLYFTGYLNKVSESVRDGRILAQMTKHPLTDQGIAKFQADYKAVFGE